MTELFLNSVKLKDFRTFGSFETQIVPAPGLTLLVGTNGLGKSSFFDALEWGLTGEVQRFKNYMKDTANEGRYLTRRGADAGTHAVGLGFHDGSCVFRTGDDEPSPDDISRILKAPDWTAVIHDIGTYLAFTHFLGQAAQQRFTSRDRSEQWASLKGPSGIDRLDEVRNGLRGRATEMAFNRRVKKEEAEVAEIGRQLEEWRDWGARLARLKDLAASSGALEDGVFIERLNQLVAALRQLSTDMVLDLTAAPADILSAVVEALDILRGRFSARKVTLDLLADVPSRNALLIASADPEAPAVREAASALATEAAALREATRASAAAQSAVTAARSASTSLQTQLLANQRLKEDAEQAASADATLRALLQERGARVDQINALEAEQTRLNASIAEVDRRAAQIAGLAAAVTIAQNVVNLATRLVQLRNQASTSQADHRSKEALAVPARTLLANIQSHRDTLQPTLDAARAAVVAARERGTVLAAAVAEIAAHLRHEDENCPVCRSKFTAGALKRLAEESAQDGDEALAAAERVVVDIRDQIQALDVQALAAQNAIELADAAKAQKDADAAEVEECAARLRGALPSISEINPVLDATAALAAAQTELETARRAAAEDTGARAEQETLRAANAVSINALNTARAADDRKRLELEAQSKAALDRLAAAGFDLSNVPRLDGILADLRAQAAAADDALTTQTENLRLAHDAETAARARHQAIADTVARLTSARESATAERTALQRRWSGAGLPNQLDPQTLQDALAAEISRLEEVQRLDEERSALAAAHLAAVQQNDLHELTGNLIRVGGPRAAEAPDLYEADLIARHEAAKAALASTNAAHKAVGAFADKLRDEARDFSVRFLSPLNNLIDDFNEALLSTPGETVRLSAAYHKDRTQFDMGLHYRDPLDDALYDTKLPPQVVLSEGQLAANGFSILCAASTAYPWSRWRSLLMDDPLQHNDIIHAAAFVDLMRNLVEMQRYQLIMSSHDRAEAEFIRRKFDAAGLPCSVITLTAPSKAGVRYLPPEHNRHALRALEAQMAQSA